MEKARKAVHVQHLIADFKRQLFSDDFADLFYVVRGTRIPVHTQILASRSEYFRNLFYGGTQRESVGEISLYDVDPLCFKLLLKYAYNGLIDMHSLTADGLGGLLDLAHKYEFSELEESMNEHVKSILNEENVCAFYMVAHAANNDELCTACLKFIDRAGTKLLASEGILNLTAPALRSVLLRDTLSMEEIDVFEAVRRWAAKYVESSEVESLLQAVRWDVLSPDLEMGDATDKTANTGVPDGHSISRENITEEEAGPLSLSDEETVIAPKATLTNNTTEVAASTDRQGPLNDWMPEQSSLSRKCSPVRTENRVAGDPQSTKTASDSAQPSSDEIKTTRKGMTSCTAAALMAACRNHYDLSPGDEDSKSEHVPAPPKSDELQRTSSVLRHIANSFVYYPSTGTDPQSTSDDVDAAVMAGDSDTDEFEIRISRKSRKQ